MQIDNKYSIDSCEVFINIDKVKSIPAELQTGIESIKLTNGQTLSTNDIDKHGISKLNNLDLRRPKITSSNKTNKDNINLNGIKYKLEKNNLIKKDFLCIQIPAKILGKDYFDGINSKNIDTIFDIVADHKIEFIGNKRNDQLNTFKDYGKFRDTDLKKDYTGIDPQTLTALINDLHKVTKHSNRIDIGTRPYLQTDNLGIDFGRRETSKVASPHQVIYHKTIEMVNNSIDFYGQYFSTSNIPQIARIETNFKDSQLWKRIDSKNTIAEILDTLDTKQSHISNIVLECFSKHLTPTADANNKNILTKEFKMNYEYSIMYEMIVLLYATNQAKNYNDIVDHFWNIYHKHQVFKKRQYIEKKKIIKYLCNVIEKDMQIIHTTKQLKTIQNDTKINTINDIFLKHNFRL